MNIWAPVGYMPPFPGCVDSKFLWYTYTHQVARISLSKAPMSAIESMYYVVIASGCLMTRVLLYLIVFTIGNWKLQIFQ